MSRTRARRAAFFAAFIAAAIGGHFLDAPLEAKRQAGLVVIIVAAYFLGFVHSRIEQAKP